jgi:UDP-N-acetylmuramoyl-tripeptide--D-alanyl-D-alanine ligase
VNIFKKILSSYICDYPEVIAYMFQASDYKQAGFVKWWLRVGDFRAIQKRGVLVPTLVGKSVRVIAGILTALYVLLSTLTIVYFAPGLLIICMSALALALLFPIYLPLAVSLPVYLLKHFMYVPRQNILVTKATDIFSNHPASIIAVAGSYGKTTMKELLGAVLGTSRKVAYTEGNKNTLDSIARFAQRLEGDEEVIIVEFGEGDTGDVARMTAMVGPDYAVVTGLAPNHLDGYKDIDDIAQDFGSLLASVDKTKAFINGDNELLVKKFGLIASAYTAKGCLGRTITHPEIFVNSSSFELVGKDQRLDIYSGLIGMHNVAVLAFAAALSLELGISKTHIEQALAETKPYEHRMEPRPLHGAWLIDDTYNGSIEGMKAGLTLLSELKTKGRKIYATPGLVDQGIETERVHVELGKLIAKAQPTEVYLMQNSVVDYVVQSLLASNYSGKLKVIDEPLQFYTNIENIVAKDDIVMCQNDWPDYYN